MTTPDPDNGLLTGMDVLIDDHLDWIRGARVGLLSHQAAVNRTGTPSSVRLHATSGVHLAALFGPEHGFAGKAGAGVLTADERHPEWRIPVFSLYGDRRAPTADMLETIDVLVVELQDLGARPYTYVSTLRLALEAAAACRKPIIVADRPIPLPLAPDGPQLDPALTSFVGMIPAPMQYAMTPAETACWLRGILNLNLDLRIAPMRCYHRDATRLPSWPPWIPPSPRIRSWDAACLFTATVFGEALPSLDYGSGTELAFQVVAAPWLDPASLITRFSQAPAPGIKLTPCQFTSASGLYKGRSLSGVRLTITDHHAFRPVATSVILLDHIRQLGGHNALWAVPGTRPEWFDKLYGTSRVRESLQAGVPASDIIDSWRAGLAAFEAERSTHLLYPLPPSS